MKLRSITDMPDIKGRRVLVRVDHNIDSDEQGQFKDDRKVRETLKTIEFLLMRGGRLILMTHIGRPDGKADEQLRTAPIAKYLKKIFPKVGSVRTMQEVMGEDVEREVQMLKEGDILYLENLRFFSGEQTNDAKFIRGLMKLGEFYVNEAFPALHTYEEASTCGLARMLPAFAGFHLQEEIINLNTVVSDPRHPLVLILSGAKMKTKIPVIRRFLDIADHILLGGCIANTFIAARGFDVGGSLYEESSVELAQELMLESEKEGKAMIHVPRDVVVASEASEDAEKIDLPAEDVSGDMKILDIGKITIERFSREIEKAGTVIWNGPLGHYEMNHFSHASKRIAESIARATAKGTFSIVGGGDTLDFHARYGYQTDAYSFTSSGGGAMLEFLSSPKPLPGLIPLMEKGPTKAVTRVSKLGKKVAK